MSEIERAAIEKAIKGFEHEIRCIKASEARSWNTETRQRKVERETLAVSLLRAELEREKNPLTCEGCKTQPYKYSFDEPMNMLCMACSRGVILPDRYEPKGEKA